MTPSQTHRPLNNEPPVYSDEDLMQSAMQRRRCAKKSFWSARPVQTRASRLRRDVSVSEILSHAQDEFKATAQAQRILLDAILNVITIAVSYASLFNFCVCKLCSSFHGFFLLVSNCIRFLRSPVAFLFPTILLIRLQMPQI